MQPAIAFERRGSEENDEAMKSPHTNFGDEVIEVLPDLSSSPNPVQATRTASVPAEKRSYFRAQSRKRSHSVFLNLTIPLLAVLLFWSICTAASSKGRAAGAREHSARVTRRRLSDRVEGIDEEEHSIVEGCLSLEAELGIFRAEAGAPSSGDRSRRIAELVAFFSDAAAEYESKQQVQQALGEGPSFGGFPAATQTGTVRHLIGGQANVPSGSGGQALQPSVHLLNYSGDYAPGVAPGLTPDAWVSGYAGTVNEQSVVKERASSWIAGTPLQGEELSLAVSLASAYRPLRDGKEQPHWLSNFGNHPFLRLPVVEAGVVPQDFDPSEIFASTKKSASSTPYLLELRRLFAQKALNQKDVDEVVVIVRELANYLWLKANESIRQVRPTFASAALGCIFWELDSLVSAVELLGEHLKLHLWWDKLVEAIDTEYSLPYPSHFARRTTVFNTKLANRLLAALRTYKTGKRPPAGEVLDLKLELLLSPLSPPLFQDARWDPFRHDHFSFVRHESFPTI